MDADVQGRVKSLAYASIVAVFMLIISLYIYGIEAFRNMGLESAVANQVFITINTKLRIFDSSILYKFLIMIILTPSLLFGINNPLKKYNTRLTISLMLLGLCVFFIPTTGWYYIICSVIGFLSYSVALCRINMGETVADNEDVFNDIEESFPQEEEKIENEYSVNLPMYYFLKNKSGKLEKRKGWINLLSIFRGTLVSGVAGSGKTFCVIEPMMQQLINKGFAMSVYDFKFPTLAIKVYNYFLKAEREGAYRKVNPNVIPKFHVVNFDNPVISYRCNPITPSLIRDDADALNAAINTMCALNSEWRKKTDFFANSAINIFAAILLFLRSEQGGKFCTFAHAVELLSTDLDKLLPILLSKPALQNITKPFSSAFLSGAVEQIQGQIASAQIPLARLATENVYYICSGNDFELDINDPQEPKVVVIGNNTQKVEAYATPLSLYFYQLIQQVNQQGKWPCCLSFDEVTTLYLSGIDRTINTARSNRVAVLLGYQDNTQLIRDYGEAQAKVIINTPGNFLSGQVQGETAEMISKFFGKKIQQRNSHSISDQAPSLTIAEQMEEIFPANKIANLSQGHMIGKVTDSYDQQIKKKLFSCIIDTDAVKVDESDFVDLPIVAHFPKTEAPQKYVREWWDDYSMQFQNRDVEHIMMTMMEKSDADNFYTYQLEDFDLEIDELSEDSKGILSQKFNVTSFENDDLIKDQFIRYIVGRLAYIGFLIKMGTGKYYVAIWMRAIIRQNYYQIKQDVTELVKQAEIVLLSDPNSLKYFRVEYLQRLQQEFGQETES